MLTLDLVVVTDLSLIWLSLRKGALPSSKGKKFPVLGNNSRYTGTINVRATNDGHRASRVVIDLDLVLTKK